MDYSKLGGKEKNYNYRRLLQRQLSIVYNIQGRL